MNIIPDWPAPATVKSLITTRLDGESQGEFGKNNLALHVGDQPEAVLNNRTRLKDTQSFSNIQWLNQTHSRHVIQADDQSLPEADGCWTNTLGMACAVLTADCLPLLLCDQSATRVAALHAGWRGLAEGIVQSGIEIFPHPEEVMVYLGPAISQQHFEVGQDVKEIFQQAAKTRKLDYPQEKIFQPSSNQPNHYWADLYELARIELRSLGVTQIYGGEYCTFSQPELFYSYRRDRVCGRMASLIWLTGSEPS